MKSKSMSVFDAVKKHISGRRAEISVLLISALLFSFFFNGRNIYAFLGTMTCMIMALVIVLYFAYQKNQEIEVSAVTFIVLVSALWLFLSILWSRIPYLSIMTSWWLAAAALVYLIFILAPRKEAIYKAVLVAVFVFGGVQGLLALYQIFIQEILPNGLFLYKNLLGSFLVLQIFVLSGLFFILPEEKKRNRYFLLSVLFFLAFVVGVIQSRGVYLSLFLSMLLFFGIAYYLQVNRTSLVTLLVTLVLAFVCAELTTLSGLSQRVMTLADPYSAGTSRFLIWQGCLEMIRNYPLWGTGLGTYWLLWPPYRSPLDTSGGYFAHNDYLQLWIEGGIPLLILLLALFVVIIVSFYKTMKAKELSRTRKMEVLSLFAGLFALAIHTFFDFNFYSIPNMILAGVILGRLDMLSSTKKWHLLPYEMLKIRTSVFRACLLIAGLTLLFFFTFVGLSHYYFEKGNKLFLKMDFAGAARSYDLSSKFWNSYDRPLYMNASLLVGLVKTGDKGEWNGINRREMYLQAGEYLRRAEKLNPYRPQIYLTKALLEEANEAGIPVVKRAFEKALKVDPLFFQGRTEYGRHLAQSGQSRKALKVLEEGMIYSYLESLPLIPYYQLTSILRRQNGDEAGAKALEEKIATIKEKSRKERSIRQREWLF